ncbi:MAG: thioredoxin-dependent thiol peroxidase [Candidatus Pacebacteria bacterium]|nr:thioredoxin-dependent thiol peroxidase [Candidatus Paceibacterota bacterium]
MPKEGHKAPGFSLPDQDGTVRSLSDYIGKRLVLYFYPKDDTPGCTIEAQVLGDSIKKFQKLGTEVIGVSADSVKSHKKFCDKFSIPFPLLSDEEKKMVNAYGVWGEKQMMGRKYMGIRRTTFVIGPQGKIIKIFENVKPPKHAEELLEYLSTGF